MKKLYPIIGILVTIIVAVIIITVNKVNKGLRYLTVSNHYSYVYSENKKIEIPIYANSASNPLSNISNYSSIYLGSPDQSSKLQIELSKISKNGIEHYISEDYYSFILSFEMPKLSSNFFIEHCFIKIRLQNNTEFNFEIGKLSLYYYENVGFEEMISINSLSGMKSNEAIISRLEEIKIEGSFNGTYQITNIIIGSDLVVTFKEEEGCLILKIDHQDLMLSNVPIIIEYKEGNLSKRQVIDNFKYFADYDILYQNGILVNVY
ncbi:hypothetical protein LJC17_03540 [Acholeplasma sp. OttesenSCG-928-E16]|nr:hypothetical protein [Acholeplasma sp. OttesenSCG-928-E16]